MNRHIRRTHALQLFTISQLRLTWAVLVVVTRFCISKPSVGPLEAFSPSLISPSYIQRQLSTLLDDGFILTVNEAVFALSGYWFYPLLGAWLWGSSRLSWDFGNQLRLHTHPSLRTKDRFISTCLLGVDLHDFDRTYALTYTQQKVNIHVKWLANLIVNQFQKQIFIAL
jgi:hypothetical protein